MELSNDKEESTMGKKSPLCDRFWEKVDRTGGPDACWEWLASKDYGYGSFGIDGRMIGAHRVAWERVYGPIPKGLCVCHHCDNPGCCNPHHLFLGTIADNNADRDRKGRQVTPRGEAHPQAKLNDRKVRIIRYWHARRGWSMAALARQFGVDEALIQSVIHRRAWAHVR